MTGRRLWGVVGLLAAASACSDEPAAPSPSGGASGMGAAAGRSGSSGAGAGGASTASSGGSSGGGSSAGLAGNAGAAGHDSAGAGAGGDTDCPIASSALAPWPGQDAVKTLDSQAQFQSDLSGLTYEAGAGALWAVDNLSGTLFRLLPSGAGFAPDTAHGWAAGKALHYPNGQGAPDAEGVTLGQDVVDGVYVCAEHDIDEASVSRLSVLRYDVATDDTALTATHEWNLTALLPPLGANTGLEAVTWVPDSYLTARGFFDEAAGHAYAPADYPDHGAGLFFVGVEQTGKIYAFALAKTGSAATRLASISTPNSGVMGLEFDRDAQNLWFSCDDTCGNRSGVLGIDTAAGSPNLGRFVVRRQFQRPSSLPNANNEGIAIAPDSACLGGFKPFYWTDDSDNAGFSLRVDTIPCACL